MLAQALCAETVALFCLVDHAAFCMLNDGNLVEM